MDGALPANSRPAARSFDVASWVRKYGLRLAKAGFGALVVGAGIWSLLRAFAFSISTQAVVAGKVAMLTAPIDGEVDTGASVAGQLVNSHDLLARITNSRVQDLFVQELEGRMGATESELASTSPRPGR